MSKQRQSMLVAGWILLPLGTAVALIFCVPLLVAGYASRNWPATEGTITYSGVARKVDTPSVHERRRGSGRHRYVYQADVRWSYDVGGAAHSGSGIWIGQWRNWTYDRQSQEAIAGDYQVGQAVDVYYDPSAPEQSVLCPGPSADTWVPLLISTFVAGLGGVLIFCGKTRQTAST